jgi:hypothetical protein
MYCSLDRLDLHAGDPTGGMFGVQTDHRSAADIEATPELSVLFAIARVLIARGALDDRGETGATVVYAMESDEEPPAFLRQVVVAAGGQLVIGKDAMAGTRTARQDDLSEDIDVAFRGLAKRAQTATGSRDPAMALRMLEDQTLASPPVRDDDEPAYWTRILELAALAGELLRSKFGGRWVQSASAALPYSFQLERRAGRSEGIAEVYPTNRAQKIVDEAATGHGAESLFKLVMAAEEILARPPDAATGRLMPSLRLRDSVELDECVWHPLFGVASLSRGDSAAEWRCGDEDVQAAPSDVPIVVVGVDGESTFAMMRREAIAQSVETALQTALANLADEEVERETITLGDQRIIVVTGSFYAAEKLLDRGFLQQLQGELGGELLAVATPARGELIVCADIGQPARLARFVAFARARFDSFVSAQLSPRVLLARDGLVVASAEPPEPERDQLRAATEPASPGARAAAAKPGFWRRLFGRGK